MVPGRVKKKNSRRREGTSAPKRDDALEPGRYAFRHVSVPETGGTISARQLFAVNVAVRLRIGRAGAIQPGQFKETDMQRSTRRSTRLLALRLAAAAALASILAIAVPVPPTQAQAPAPNPSAPANIPDDKLDAAAAAIEQVATIKETYQQRIDTASPPDKQRLADEANAALSKAVTDRGLSVQEYSAILAMAQTDPDLRGKILQRLNLPGKQ
jgi:hypothetical protein